MSKGKKTMKEEKKGKGIEKEGGEGDQVKIRDGVEEGEMRVVRKEREML